MTTLGQERLCSQVSDSGRSIALWTQSGHWVNDDQPLDCKRRLLTCAMSRQHDCGECALL